MPYKLAKDGVPYGRTFEAPSRAAAHDRALRKEAPQCAELNYDGKVLRVLTVEQEAA